MPVVLSLTDSHSDVVNIFNEELLGWGCSQSQRERDRQTDRDRKRERQQLSQPVTVSAKSQQ